MLQRFKVCGLPPPFQFSVVFAWLYRVFQKLGNILGEFMQWCGARSGLLQRCSVEKRAAVHSDKVPKGPIMPIPSTFVEIRTQVDG